MSQSRLTPADGSLPPGTRAGLLAAAQAGLRPGGRCGASLIAGFTLIYVLRAKPGDLPEMALLRSYFLGYTPTLPGAIIGGLWGVFVGFVAGWFFAFCRNFAVALSVFIIRAKAELNQSRDFLDHI